MKCIKSQFYYSFSSVSVENFFQICIPDSDKDIYTFKVFIICNSSKMNEIEFLPNFIIWEMHENHEYEHNGIVFEIQIVREPNMFFVLNIGTREIWKTCWKALI